MSPKSSAENPPRKPVLFGTKPAPYPKGPRIETIQSRDALKHPEKSTLWTDTGVDQNFQRDLGAIGPYEISQLGTVHETVLGHPLNDGNCCSNLAWSRSLWVWNGKKDPCTNGAWKHDRPEWLRIATLQKCGVKFFSVFLCRRWREICSENFAKISKRDVFPGFKNGVNNGILHANFTLLGVRR